MKNDTLPSKEIIKTAQEHIDLALKVLATESFVASRFLSLAQRRWRNVPTMRLNATIVPLALDINPYFAATMPANLLLSCFYTECIRIALHHCTRSATPENAYTLASIFICEKQAKSSIPYNKIDFKKYILSEKDFFNITQNEFFLEERIEDWKKNKSFDILNTTISSTYSSILNNLFNKMKKLNKKEFLIFNNIEEAFSLYYYPGIISEENQNQNSGNSSESNDSNSDSDESNNTGNSNSSESNDNNSQQIGDSTIYLDGNQSNKENPSNGTSKEWQEEESINKAIQHAASEMKDLSSNDWGTLDNSSLKTSIIAINAPRIDEREILKKFNQTVKDIQINKTRMKPNRRKNADFGTIGYRHKYKSKVLFAVDTSGSMDDESISLGITIAIKCLPDAEIKLCYWDTHATEPIDIKYMKNRNEYANVCGGGGTMPNCIFDMLKTINIKTHYDGVIVFSDMFFASPTKEKKKTIWISCTNKEDAKLTCYPTWGTRLELDDLIKSEQEFSK